MVFVGKEGGEKVEKEFFGMDGLLVGLGESSAIVVFL